MSPPPRVPWCGGLGRGPPPGLPRTPGGAQGSSTPSGMEAKRTDSGCENLGLLLADEQAPGGRLGHEGPRPSRTPAIREQLPTDSITGVLPGGGSPAAFTVLMNSAPDSCLREETPEDLGGFVCRGPIAKHGDWQSPQDGVARKRGTRAQQTRELS